ncbi:hypothetical protein VZT92_018507 [Zoarces viviparus]|uniref:Uncharacterized protein n=1 Tax=Zoarces viviparus TaxID=48416 RepID=A0AAW1EHZ3_ZOAVI
MSCDRPSTATHSDYFHSFIRKFRAQRDDEETTRRRRGDDEKTTWRRRGDDEKTTWRRRGDDEFRLTPSTSAAEFHSQLFTETLEL